MNTIIDLFNNTLIYNKNNIDFIIDITNNIWFKFSHITKLLKYKSRKDAIRDHLYKKNKIKYKDIKAIIKTKDHPDTIYINESGLYTFLIKSRMKGAVDFQLWLVNDVLPNLRKNGKYEIDKIIKSKLKKLNKKIKLLEKNNQILKNNMTINKFPKGTHIYVIEDNGLYKIGYTDNLKKRLAIYNTGKANKINYCYYKKTKCAVEIESCMKAILNKYIHKSRKEFYNCNLDKIIYTITKCLKIEKNCKKCSDIFSLNGGSYIIDKIISDYKDIQNKIITYLNHI